MGNGGKKKEGWLEIQSPFVIVYLGGVDPNHAVLQSVSWFTSGKGKLKKYLERSGIPNSI